MGYVALALAFSTLNVGLVLLLWLWLARGPRAPTWVRRLAAGAAAGIGVLVARGEGCAVEWLLETRGDAAVVAVLVFPMMVMFSTVGPWCWVILEVTGGRTPHPIRALAATSGGALALQAAYGWLLLQGLWRFSSLSANGPGALLFALFRLDLAVVCLAGALVGYWLATRR